MAKSWRFRQRKGDLVRKWKLPDFAMEINNTIKTLDSQMKENNIR